VRDILAEAYRTSHKRPPFQSGNNIIVGVRRQRPALPAGFPRHKLGSIRRRCDSLLRWTAKRNYRTGLFGPAAWTGAGDPARTIMRFLRRCAQEAASWEGLEQAPQKLLCDVSKLALLSPEMLPPLLSKS
jgi:hypothetical protein